MILVASEKQALIKATLSHFAKSYYSLTEVEHFLYLAQNQDPQKLPQAKVKPGDVSIVL